jgi:hypothetical protein
MKASRLHTYVLIDRSGRVTNQLVKRKTAPKTGNWVEVTGGCCRLDVLADPVPTSASIGATGFTVNWSAITGADYYIVQRATDTAFTAGKNTQTVSAVTLAYTGLVTATTYYVRVKAIDTTTVKEDSDWSTTLTVVTS